MVRRVKTMMTNAFKLFYSLVINVHLIMLHLFLDACIRLVTVMYLMGGKYVSHVGELTKCFYVLFELSIFCSIE